MTPKQADKIIKSAKTVTVCNSKYNEKFTALFVKRDRWNIFSLDGGVFDRGELEIIEAN